MPPPAEDRAGPKILWHYNPQTLPEKPPQPGSVRDRLLVALAYPAEAGKAGIEPATLIAVRDPILVFEWLGTGKGLVLLDRRGLTLEEVAVQLDRILDAHERGLLFIAVLNAGQELEAAMRAADERCHNRDNLGLYRVDESGKIAHVAGRRLAELEKAGRALPIVPPLTVEDVSAIIERGHKERQEAVEFVKGTARRFPHLTVALIAFCVLLFALTSGDDPRALHVRRLLCNDPDGVRLGEVWRLLSYAFLHANTTHLLVNMLSLYSLGAFLEPLLGRARLGLFFAVTAFVGGLTSTVFLQEPSVGASGAVWGLVGATFGFLTGRQRMFPALIARSMRRRLYVILAINLALSFLPGIDRYAHFGGGLSGYGLALLVRRSAKRA
jgi:membrane associated rhomboid family serine protease